MKKQLETQLRNDGQHIRMLAQDRLATLDLNQKILDGIDAKKNPANSKRIKYLSLAAVLCLSVLLGSLIQEHGPKNQVTPTSQLKISASLNQKIKQIPASIEQNINQPLQDEQQAIISDLKALKQQLLSI
ncbi:hypothetical protein [Marinicella litoralis]|uniref:Uncharacterized protein n=1 Tax=Marinicella litoralis TaxID=644220 RepID=A0A4R6Y156_9GAMM|nr:hypothetical protein [Marinicella litoralis]TDR23883.1 hypothetical protein C8D91_0750 [Marinicella litoralis]